ncbi:anoctamin-6-like, partial [Dendronephthya gigantea]|uniref:anoctamin-6-like n=1 Tax=Dendronephthya gigantea TaxID=151771 RepID=UPI00106AA62C
MATSSAEGKISILANDCVCECDETPLLTKFASKSRALDFSSRVKLITEADSVEYKGPYFRDGERSIDMTLVFQSNKTQSGVKSLKSREKREIFVNKLIMNGVQLEVETAQQFDTDIFFIKLHVPLATLQTKAEEMKLKIPFSILSKNPEMDVAIASLPFTSRDKQISPLNHRYFLLTPFVKRHAEKFMAKGDCFSTLDRIAVCERILNETRFSTNEKEFGIKPLLKQKIFNAVYPPHDSGKDLSAKNKTGRQKLAKDWASLRSTFKMQPINTVRSYLGTSIAFYFIWLGFSAWWLWPLAMVSMMVIIYGSLPLSGYPPVEEICKKTNTTQYLMCPQCDECDFWYLNEVCVSSRITHILNNTLTVILSFLVAIWSLFFIKFWNRYHSKMVFQWQTYEIEKTDEPSRPEFLSKVKTFRRNIVTDQLEQFVPLSTLCYKYSLVILTMILIITLALASLLGVVIYRSAVYTVLITQGNNNARVITDITAGVITLVCINVLCCVYEPIARRLTDWENSRTQSEWENSFTYKMFAFQFINWYSSLFYIAFFKTEYFTGRPGGYIKYGEYQLEGCSALGCSMELSIQLAVIMIGQMFLQNITELSKPYLLKWMVIRKSKVLYNRLLPWQQEYFLTSSDDTLFWEHMEIVLQFGFVLMFTAAFPLAPLIAFINSIIEIRLDAIKFIHFQRRPIPKMAV